MGIDLTGIPFFSIIVPIYNCEKYLGECIESVMIQSFDNWELLLIDDGSTDLSGEICEEYLKKDYRIKVVHKQNGGEFSARKAGLNIATGQYITGLDADDYYEREHLKSVYEAIQKNDVDCVSFPLHHVGARDDYTDQIAPCEKVISGDEFLLYCIKKNGSSFCDKAIKAGCYINTDYTDAPDVRFSEDELMVFPALCNVKTVCGISSAYYRYRLHDESANAKRDFKYIEYLDEIMKYNIMKFKKAGVLTKAIEKEYLGSFLHSLNVRIWDLFLTDLWEENMEIRVERLSPFSTTIPKEILLKFNLKERIRIYLIIKKRFNFLKRIATIYRIAGKINH